MTYSEVSKQFSGLIQVGQRLVVKLYAEKAMGRGFLITGKLLKQANISEDNVFSI